MSETLEACPFCGGEHDEYLGFTMHANSCEAVKRAKVALAPKPPEELREAASIADRIEAQATCLEGYAESSGHAGKRVPSVFHLQAMHFRDLAAELRLLPPAIDRERVEREAYERAANSIAQWSTAQSIRLCAGEMTAQEMRTAKAVLGGVERRVRALSPEAGK